MTFLTAFVALLAMVANRRRGMDSLLPDSGRWRLPLAGNFFRPLLANYPCLHIRGSGGCRQPKKIFRPLLASYPYLYVCWAPMWSRRVGSQDFKILHRLNQSNHKMPKDLNLFILSNIKMYFDSLTWDRWIANPERFRGLITRHPVPVPHATLQK